MRRRTMLATPVAGCWVAAPAAVAARAPGPDEVVLGQTGILSGPLGEVIKTFLSGATAVFDDIGRRGGVHGRRIRLVSLDDRLEPQQAVANYKKLLEEENAFAFFGCVGSGTTAAAAPALKASGAPLVGGYAVADSARDRVKGMAYFVRATTGREAEVLLGHLTTLGISRIGVAQLDNPGGQEALGLLSKAMEVHRIQPARSVAVKGDGSNIDAVAAQLSDPQLQAVVMYLGGPLGANLIKAIRALGSSPRFYGMSIVPGELSAKLLGEQVRGLAISQVVPYPWASADATAIAYRRLMERQNLTVGYYTYEGYINARVMAEALERCGRELSHQRLHAVLQSMRMTLAGMTVDFNGGSHTGSRFVELVAVTRDGRFVR